MFSVCTLMRDSVKVGSHEINQVQRFFEQCEKINPDRYFIVEGDSADNTFSVLGDFKRKLGRVELFKCNVGGKVASVVDTNRFKNLSKIGNIVLEAAINFPSDLILWIESDFIVPDGTFERLIDFTKTKEWNNSLGICGVPTSGDYFYDVWGYEGINGEKYSSSDLIKFTRSSERYTQMRSFGSMVLLNGANLKIINGNFGNGCFPHLCKMGIDNGLELWCDNTAIIHHPNSFNYHGRQI